MWRFKPSKFKNAAPKVPKKAEGWITDICVGTPYSYGNHIKASAAFMAFNVDSGGGGCLGILPINDFGSKNKNCPRLNAHSEFITDFDFCPYDDGILATGSQDHHVKIWRIPDNGLKNETLCNPLVDILLENRMELLNFHPVVDCILTTADDCHIRLWDVNTKQQIYVNSGHEELVQSFCWKPDGQLLASCGRDKKLRICDPRSPDVSQVTASHSNDRDARVVWLGDSNQVLTTGFGSGREREVIIRDIKKFDEPLATYSGESSLGVLIPLFDSDTNMLFLVAKADTTVSYWEIIDRMPFYQEAIKYLGDVQAKGAALVPKRGLKVMEGEVNRLLLLGPDCIVPISYQVPRKSYRDFHADLFPDTRAPEPSMIVPQWQAGDNLKADTISLAPKGNLAEPLFKFSHDLGNGSKNKPSSKQDSATPIISISEIKESFENLNLSAENNKLPKSKNAERETVTNHTESSKSQKPSVAPKPSLIQDNAQMESENNPTNCKMPVFCNTPVNNTQKSVPVVSSKPNQSPSPRRPIRSFGIRVSKFRHLNGLVLPKDTHFTAITSLTRTIPGESDGFIVNKEFIALPLGVAGGLIAILKLSSPGRAPSLADVPGVICGTNCMDFTWDPFDTNRLVTACDNGDIQIWNITEDCLREKVSEPSSVLRALSEKVSIVKFHPCARDVICTAGNDLCIRIWDLNSKEEKLKLEGHTDQILCLAWSPCGQYIATVCKDQKVRVYEPRKNSLPIEEGAGPEGTRGARIVWVLGGSHLVVSGFSKVSERHVYLYNFKDLSTPVGKYGLDVCPSTLIPYYDEDSSTLFLTGKGDSTVYAFEVALDSPYFHPLSHYKCSGSHQALAFLPKIVCNVKEVEFARAVRLTTSSIEPISFFVPRLRVEYFQDDLFPDTRVTWKPHLTSEEWFASKNVPSQFVSLKPPEMIKLSDAPPPTKTVNTNQSTATTPSEIVFEGEVVLEGSLSFLQNSKEKEEMIVQSMKSQCQFQENSLPQDSFDGVDPAEWDEEEEMHSKQNL